MPRRASITSQCSPTSGRSTSIRSRSKPAWASARSTRTRASTRRRSRSIARSSSSTTRTPARCTTSHSSTRKPIPKRRSCSGRSTSRWPRSSHRKRTGWTWPASTCASSRARSRSDRESVAELRKDPTRGQWVLIRPKGTWAPDAPCRYCPGAEHLTGAEISAYRKDGSLANGPGWTVRVVPEADAYFRIEWELVREGVGMFDMITPRGASELIVESPNHDDTLATMDPDQIEAVLWMYRDRLLDLKRDGQIRDILINRHHKKPGVPLHHPYSRVTAIWRVRSPRISGRSPVPSGIPATRWSCTQRRTSNHASCRATGRPSATTTTGTSRLSSIPSAPIPWAGSTSTRRRPNRSPRSCAARSRSAEAHCASRGSGIEPANPIALRDAADAFHERRGSEIGAYLRRQCPHAVERAGHDLLQPRGDLAFAPEVIL